MPDLGRWNGIDQLAESYFSTSPYAYVANNPISNTDPDGRWINEDGSIRPSTTFDYMPGSYKPMYSFSSSTGMSYNSESGGGGGYTPFGNTQAYTDLMASFQNGGDFSLKVNNGYMSWWTGGALGDANTAQEMIAHMMKLNSYAEDIWNGKLPRNEFIDSVINNKYYNLTSLGLDKAIAKSSGYLTKALETKSYVNFTLLNKYAKPAFRTNVAGSLLETSKVANVAKGLKVAGSVLAGVGMVVSTYQYSTGQISGLEYGIDTAATVIGFMGPVGATVSLIYFGAKATCEYNGYQWFDKPSK